MAKMHKIRFPLGQLTALPQTLKGATSERKEGKRRVGKGGERRAWEAPAPNYFDLERSVMFITMSAAARVNAVFSRGLSSPDRRQAAPLWSRDSRSVTWYTGLAGAMTRKWESPATASTDVHDSNLTSAD